MTATLATRQRLKAYIDAMPDEEVAVVANILLPPAPAAPPQGRDPLIFTKEESESRLLKGLAQLDAEQTVPLETFMQRLDQLIARHVPH